MGASLELPFFPMKRTVALSLEKPRKFDPLDFGNSESFSTRRVWKTCVFFSPKHVKVSFQLGQTNYITLETSCFILETARMNISLYSALQDFILIYSEANLLFLIYYSLISCKIETYRFRILFKFSFCVYPQTNP